MKKRSIIAEACAVIAATVLAIVVAVPFAGDGSQTSAANAGLDGCDNTGITSLVVAHGNDGEEIDPASIDSADYDGYVFELTEDAPASLSNASVLDEFEGRITYHEVSGLYSADSLQSIDAFVDESYIDYIEPDYVVRVADVDEDAPEGAAEAKDNSSSPDDPQYADQWNLTQMNVSGAWDKGLYGQRVDKSSSSDVVVAIVDSGIVGTGGNQKQHEDLDYSHILDGVNLADRASGTPDTLGHGTFVAGLIAAKSNNGLGISGIAPEVYIYPVRIFGSSDYCKSSTVTDGIYEAVKGGADVINLSLGSTYTSSAEEKACQYAVNNGAIFVAAAGNSGVSTNEYPAAYDCVIGVTSTNQDETLSYFSNYGEKNVYVAAPGAEVTSLSNAFGSSGESQYKTASGTSFSCPEVAALAALSKSVFPDYSQDDFKELLKETSRDKGATGYDKYYGWGIVNFDKATESLLEKVYEPTYYLSFNIVDQDGVALSDVDLQVTAAEGISWVADSSAGIEAGAWKKGTVIELSEDGTYHLHKGTYRYSVSKDGYTTKTAEFNIYKEQQIETITLEKTYDLTLKIVDTAGDELDGAKVALERIEGEALQYSIEQGDDGLYTNKTPSGTYHYTIAVTGYEESSGYLTVVTKDLTEYVTMYVSDEVCCVSFGCRSGNEQGDAVTGMSISLEDSNGNSIPTMSGGSYLLPRGARYYYTATRPGYEDQTGKFKVDSATSQMVTVVMMPAINLVYMEITDQSGDELEDVELELKDSNDNVMNPVKTDDVLFNLEPGTYSFIVNCAGYGVKNGTFEVSSSDSYKYLTVVMKAATGTLKLNATDSEGNAVNGATFVVYNADDEYQMPASGEENTWYLSKGSYQVIAQASDYEVKTTNYDVVVGQTVSKSIVLIAQRGEPEGFSGGDGTAASPYMITTEAQLRSIAGDENLLDKCFVLFKDITLSDSDWTPIGQYISDSDVMFTGSFDGAGHTVSGFKVNVNSGLAGFFGLIKGATIKNLRVEGTVVSTADGSAGGLVGGIYNVTGDDAKSSSTKITNCEFKGTVRGLKLVGGLVGYAYTENPSNDAANIYISRCIHTGSSQDMVMASGGGVTDSGVGIAGGVVGVAYTAKITSCYNTVAVEAKTAAGGITGSTGYNSGTYSCYNTANVTVGDTNGYAGGITGLLYGTISNCYWLEGTGPSDNAGESDFAYSNSANGKKSRAELQDSTFVNVLNNCDGTIDKTFVAVSNDYPKLFWELGSTPVASTETPVYAVQPQNASYQVGASDVTALTAKVEAVSDGGTLSYQWYCNDMCSMRDADAIEGANGTLDASNNYSTSYTPRVGEAGTSYYYVVVTNSVTDANGVTRRSSACSDFARIDVTVLTSATVPTVSGASIVDSQGQTVTIDTYEQNAATDNQVKVEASANDDGALSYQWYKSRYATTKGVAVDDATAEQLTIDTSRAGSFYYYCKVTNTLDGNTATANSARAHVTVNGNVTHTITYMLNDGINNDDNPSSYTEGMAVTLKDPTRDGYEFDGWYTSEDFTGEAVTKISVAATTDYTLYAKWSQKTVGPTPTPDLDPTPTPDPDPTPSPSPSPTPSPSPSPTPTPTPTDLTAAKAAAKAELQTLVSDSGLTGDELAAVQKLADEASDKIEAATTAEEVSTQLEAGKVTVQAKIDELKLAAAKAQAKVALAKLLEQETGLSDTAKASVQKEIDACNAKIDAATSVSDLAKVTADAKTAVEKAVSDAKAQDKKRAQFASSLVKLSATKLVYTGKNLNPKVTVVCMGRTLVQGTDYTLAYEANKYVGTASVTVTGIGNYDGTITKAFTIVPKATKVKKLTASKRAVKVTWAKRTKQASGYLVRYSFSKNMKGAKTITVKSAKVASKTIKKLTTGKRCYVKVRVFTTQGNAKLYSAWSKAKSAVVK